MKIMINFKIERKLINKACRRRDVGIVLAGFKFGRFEFRDPRALYWGSAIHWGRRPNLPHRNKYSRRRELASRDQSPAVLRARSISAFADMVYACARVHARCYKNAHMRTGHI